MYHERQSGLIDIHTHILPMMDDGSSSLKESLNMLELEQKQNVSIIVATPHFYAGKDTPDSFLNRRLHSAECLKEYTKKKQLNPAIVLGSEVAYFAGICKCKELYKLQIVDTKLVLIEMPMSLWNQRMISEIKNIKEELGLMPVIAHLERYLQLQPIERIEQLLEAGVLIQVNAAWFLKRNTRRKAMALFQAGFVDFLGSDCHNMKQRKPDIGLAASLIRKHVGENIWNEWVMEKQKILSVQ